mgnify:CR=1 FL=1
MAFLDAACPKLQAMLKDISESNVSSMSRAPVGFLDAVRSPMNLGGVTVSNLETRGGGKKTVEVVYAPATCEADIITTPGAICTGNKAQTLEVQQVNTNSFIGTVARSLSINDVRQLCGPDLTAPALLRHFLEQDIRTIEAALDQALLAFYAAGVGGPLGQPPGTVIPVNLMTQSSPNAPDVAGWHAALAHYYRIRGVGMPIVVGGGILDTFFGLKDWGCCNNGGIDLSQSRSSAAYFRDYYADTVLGTNEFAMWSPGAVQLVQWVKNEGEFARSGDTYSHSTIVDPMTGLQYDVNIVYDPCTETWKWNVGISFGLWIMPFQWNACTGEGMQGVNGTLQFEATQLCPAPCPPTP